MYKCKYFKIRELVHPDLLKTIPENTLWMMFDNRLLEIADRFRKKYGPIFINGRGLVDCGLRDINSKTGAKYSAHKLGRALDLHIVSIEDQNLDKDTKIKKYNEVRQEYIRELKYGGPEIMERPDLFDCINFENNISWLHIDTYNRPNKLFNP